MTFAVKRAGGEHRPDRLGQRRIRQRAGRSAPPRVSRRPAINAGAAARETRQTAARPYGLPLTGELTALMV